MQPSPANAVDDATLQQDPLARTIMAVGSPPLEGAATPESTPKMTDGDDSKEDKDIEIRECRVCLENEHPEEMVAPCICNGSLRYAHLKCLQTWVRERASLKCEICKTKYVPDVLLLLKPEVDAVLARRARSRTSSNNTATIITVTTGDYIEPQDEEPQVVFYRRPRFWLHLFIGAGILGLLVCILVFLGLRAGDEMWAAVLLRVLAFGLPLIIVVRATMACCELRRVEHTYVNREIRDAAV